MRPRCLALSRQAGPVVAVQQRAAISDGCCSVAASSVVEQRAPFLLRQCAQVAALPFEQVVGQQHAPGSRAAAWPPASCGRCASAVRRRAAARSLAPDQRSRRRAPCRRASASPTAAISGKRSVTSSSPRDHSQTLARAPHQLGADAVPLPFDDPLRGSDPARRRTSTAAERVRQEEGIGLAAGRWSRSPPLSGAISAA